MRENDIKNLDGLISASLRESVSAPQELRHNVMSAIADLDAQTSPQRRAIPRFVRYAPALACVAIVCFIGVTFLRNGGAKSAAPPQYGTSFDYTVSNGADSGGAVPEIGSAGGSATGSLNKDMLAAPPAAAPMPTPSPKPEENYSDTPMYAAAPADDSESPAASAETAAIAAEVIVATDELPDELRDMESVALDDGTYLFENVPHDTVEKLLKIGAVLSSGDLPEGTVSVLWTPGNSVSRR
ncbi:MAG: hypothetical protein LBN99_06090 [Oscillospiraceae bacterium]|jgi:hypothetical protein|nr:hypothetical protein [Oscillospiraceae bacterium]